MSIALSQEVKRLRQELEELKERVKTLETKKKPGPKPKVLNAVG